MGVLVKENPLLQQKKKRNCRKSEWNIQSPHSGVWWGSEGRGASQASSVDSKSSARARLSPLDGKDVQSQKEGENEEAIITKSLFMLKIPKMSMLLCKDIWTSWDSTMKTQKFH